MRKFVVLLVLGILFLLPFSASAQTDVALYSVNVQLWPEYDQPSMLVIVDFKVAPMTSLPVDLSFRIPSDANLIAVAYEAPDEILYHANFSMSAKNDYWQTFRIPVEQNLLYRFEYYQPLIVNGKQRTFSYSWDNSYEVKNFSVSVLEPLDATAFSMRPNYISQQVINSLNFYQTEEIKLNAGDLYTLNLQYERSSPPLISESQQIQPATPLDEDTQGRVSLTSFLPYMIGSFGVLFIVIGVVYYWRFGRSSSKRMRRRKKAMQVIEENDAKTGIYCAKCGSRSKTGDKFCRTCGAKL